MSPPRVKDTDLGLAREERNVRRLARGGGVVVEVGIFNGEIATYGAVNEFGSSDGRVPARSFLRSAFDDNEQAYAAQLAEGAARIQACTSDVNAELTRMGLRAQGDVKRRVVELSAPPNAPATIVKKGSSNPLIDTGALLSAVVFEVTTGSGSGSDKGGE